MLKAKYAAFVLQCLTMADFTVSNWPERGRNYSASHTVALISHQLNCWAPNSMEETQAPAEEGIPGICLPLQ